MPNSISSASGWIPRVLLSELRGGTRNTNGQDRAAGGSQQTGKHQGERLMDWGKGSRLPGKPATKGRAQYDNPFLGVILSCSEHAEDQ